MNTTRYELSSSGQLVEVIETRSAIINSEQIFNVLKEQVNAPEDETPVADQIGNLKTFYNLGDGVCGFQREYGSSMKTFGGVMLQKIPFYTQWVLNEEAAIHELIPWTGRGDVLDIGAPLMMDVPDDLIVHFFVEWKHSMPINIINPSADLVWRLPELLRQNSRSHYLTAFSRSRNTCVRLPLPNLYDDARLCTGSAFRAPGFANPRNHWGFTTSVKTYAHYWAQTAWNTDLLGGPDSRLSRQYCRFVRFNAHTGKYRPFSGCEDWNMSTSPVPLEDVYRPWMSNERPTMPQIVPGEEGLSDTGEEIPEAEPAPATQAGVPGGG